MSADSTYEITIRAHGEDTDELPAVSATVQVGDDGRFSIVELTVRASGGGELPTQVARNIDFEMLARALTGAVETPHRPGVPASATSDAVTGENAPERPYRKMPDIEEVKEAFLETRSVGQLARQYAVPRYTAQAWVNRLRRLGHLEDAKRPAAKA